MKKIESIHELIEVARRMPVGQLPDTYFLTHIRPRLKVPRQTAVELNWMRMAAGIALVTVNVTVWYLSYRQNFVSEPYYNLSNYLSANQINF